MTTHFIQFQSTGTKPQFFGSQNNKLIERCTSLKVSRNFIISRALTTKVVEGEISEEDRNDVVDVNYVTLANGNNMRELSEGQNFFTETGQQKWVKEMQNSQFEPDMHALLREMNVDYDPDRLAAIFESRKLEMYKRSTQVGIQLGGFIAKLVQDYLMGMDVFQQRMPKRAEELRYLLSSLGPTFVKIGQALSARPDLLPQIYLDALSGLQDRLPSFPSDIAYDLIQQELGVSANELFSEITPEPVAAASLGQVYKGRLRKEGDLVAIKIQRPGIADNIALDMVLLRRLMKIVDYNLPKVGISQPLLPLVDEFAQRLFGEMDYEQEGRNCEKFQELYGHIPRVSTPSIYWDYTSKRVLTMEWIEGVKLTDKAQMEAQNLDVVDFVSVGIDCTLRQLLENGYFHADPHPGNLLATTKGDLVYLDFGMMSEVPEYARYAIIVHVVHLINRDYEAMCQDYYKLEFMDRSIDTSPIAPSLAEFFDDVLNQSVSKLNFKTIVDGLGGVLFKYPFRVPAYYALILRCLTVLEGMAMQADPNFKLIGNAYPYMAQRLLTDPAPELRESFEELVLIDGEVRWNRIENLIREGSKSSNFDSEKLWMLADWLFSDVAGGLRKPLAEEVARMMDSFTASGIREGLKRRTGQNGQVDNLVPRYEKEQEDTERLQKAFELVSHGVTQQVSSVKGEGPFGLWSPFQVFQAVERVQKVVNETLPKVQQVSQLPGAQDMANQIFQQVSRRFIARTIKYWEGQQLVQSTTATQKQITDGSQNSNKSQNQ
eukprot:TRINITY_DN6411_c1_g2_i1.p1 TRINITY_DN6411_c1_g2~~TRINITY_DN6411_c1_g2_i1.p1  ORF type:complete len:772 (-),score=111.76 TRINITY_DN6411_c1_g2_i1:714-3029(-)